MRPADRGSSNGATEGLGGPFEARVHLAPTAPGEARRLIRGWLQDHARTDDATLAVSEVVTNAVRHGNAKAAAIALRLRETDDGFRIEVDQATTETVEAPAGFPSPDRGEGRGLAVVEALAQRWGITYGTAPANGTTVWFEM